VLANTISPVGGFGCSGSEKSAPPPSSVLHCLNGNLLAALIGLGWLEDERVRSAVRWQALAITGSDPGFRYYKTGTTAAGFGCAAQPCGWGANKAVAGLLAIPAGARSAEVKLALEQGVEFLLSRDPAVADYPYSGRVSSTWLKLGMPFSYWSDFLETVENLVDLGYGADARLDRAFDLLESKRGRDGRWRMENSVNGKTWADVEAKGKPSKWITLRALRTFQKAGRAAR
jgi:hypothetical protein